MLPTARTTESDGALGNRPSAAGLPQAILGQCTSGDYETPTSLADSDLVRAEFGKGRAVEAACYALDNGLAKSVVICRQNTSNAQAISAVDDTDKEGSSVITVDGGSVVSDDYEIKVKFGVTGNNGIGTIGSSTYPITLQISFDAGRNYGPAKALGVANTYDLDFAGGIKINFAAGTIEDGDVISFQTEAAHPDDTELGDSLDALKGTSLAYELIQLTSPVDSTAAGICDTWLAGMHAIGRHKNLIAPYRVQGIYASDEGGADESYADYTQAFNDEFEQFASTSMYIAAGACKLGSSVTRGRKYRRPPSMPVAALMSSVSEEIDIAAIDVGRLPNCEIRDAKGNPDPGYYDESVAPGLDDARALTLRTWEGETGVYCNNPRIISPIGSDFDFSPKRRVMNLARTEAVAFLRKSVMSKPLKANKKTGKLRESELLALEAAVNARLASKILAKPKATSCRVTLSRTDDVLNPPYPLTGKLRMVPLVYIKDATIDAGWELSEPIEITGVAA